VSACCSTYGNVAGAHFDEKIARRDLENYRKSGAGPTARLPRDMLVDTGAVDGAPSKECPASERGLRTRGDAPVPTIAASAGRGRRARRCSPGAEACLLA